MDDQTTQWLAEYRQGNNEALGHLVEHYRRPLYGFILNMIQNSGEAEEIFQETWYRAIKSLDRYRDRKFLSWLFRISHNLVIDRARKVRPMVDLGGPDTENGRALENLLESTGPSPAHAIDQAELGQRIERSIGRLPPEQREVFLMRMKGDLPFREIAKIQKVSINTALARMQYAMAKLRQELNEDYAMLGRG